MRKRLALVLLAPECSSWQSGATGAASAPWPGMPPVFAPWAAAQAFTQAWLDMLMELLAWMLPPRTGD